MLDGGRLEERRRPRLAFFDYPDVFEDFYPHYGVTQQAFASDYAATGNHAFVEVLQREVGDVTWYESSVAPLFDVGRHQIGFLVRMVPSSWLHRLCWRAFYGSRLAWRWSWTYPVYAVVASYLAPLSLPLIRALVRQKPDAIVAQEYATGRFDVLLLVSKLLGVPLVVLHAGSRPERYLGKMAKRWTIPRADVLVVSDGTEAEMLATRYGVARERIKIILTPIDTERFRPMDREESCRLSGLDPARRWLLYVGRLDNRVKRVSALIEAFASVAGDHPQASLAIAGDGADRERLHELARALTPDRIRFLGWMSADALTALYNAADCLVLPSRNEGFPTVVGQAMACGAPVLASRVGSIPELVREGETGWLIAPGDDEALRQRLRWVLEHAERVRLMRPAVREAAVSRVSSPRVVEALRDCFRSAGVPHV